MDQNVKLPNGQIMLPDGRIMNADGAIVGTESEQPSSALPPPMLPVRRERLFTEASAQETKESAAKLKRYREAAGKAYDADFARWESLPDSEKKGSFFNWVNDAYVDRTRDEATRLNTADMGKFKGREKASLWKSAVRKGQAITGQLDKKATGGIRDWLPDPRNPLGLPYQAAHVMHSALGGDSKRNLDIQRYMEMRAPVQERTFKETMGDIKDSFSTLGNAGRTLRSMLDPGDIAVTTAGLIPVGGEAGLVTRLLRAGAKTKGIAGKAASVAAKVARNPYVGAMPLSAVSGGLSNMAVDESGNATRAFQAGVVPGFIMGGLGELGQAAGKDLKGWSKYDPDAPAVDPNAAPTERPTWEDDVEVNRAARAAKGKVSLDETPYSIEDFMGSNNFMEMIKKGRIGLEAEDFLRRHGKTIVPTMPEGLPVDKQMDLVKGEVKAAKEAKAAADAAPKATVPKPLTKAQEMAHGKKIAEAKAINSIPAGLDETSLAGMSDAQIKDAVKARILLEAAGEDVSGYHDFGTYQDGVAARDAARLKVNGEKPDPKAKAESDRNAAAVDAALDVFNMKPHQGESFRIDKIRAKKIRDGLIADDGRLSQRLAQEGYAPSDITELMTLAKNTDAMSDDAISGILTGKPLWAESDLTKLENRNANYRDINNKERAQAIGGELDARDAMDTENARLDQAAQQTLQGQTDEVLRSEAQRVAAEEPGAMRTAEQDLGDTEKARLESQTQKEIEHLITDMDEKDISSFMSKKIVENPALAEAIWSDPKKLMEAKAAANKNNPLRAEAQKRLDANLAIVAGDVKKVRRLPKGFM